VGEDDYMKAEKDMLPDVVLPQVQLDLGAMSDRGKIRLTNEDHYLVAVFERGMRALLTSLPEEDIPHDYADIGYGLLVADGMGGAAGGEVASRTAISALIELALRTPDWIMRLDEGLANEVLHRLNQRVKQVDAALIEKARNDPSLTGMGTTITIACSIGANLLIANVGDSRAYLFRKGQLYRLTCDHTVAQALANAGAIGQEDVESHPMRHLLTQVVGSEGGMALADLRRLQLADGDQILLCTDGLTDMVSEAAITQSLALGRPAAQACRALVEMALEGGGRDNITVVLARYRMPQ
jgi:serine/threonine protein phosphatase PrpC